MRWTNGSFVAVVLGLVLVCGAVAPAQAVDNGRGGPATVVAAAQPRADLLLVTVTEVEAKAVLALAADPKPAFIGDQTYHDLGTMGGARVYMLQTEMSANGPGGSMLAIGQGIRDLHPAAVVMVGIPGAVVAPGAGLRLSCHVQCPVTFEGQHGLVSVAVRQHIRGADDDVAQVGEVAEADDTAL